MDDKQMIMRLRGLALTGVGIPRSDLHEIMLAAADRIEQLAREVKERDGASAVGPMHWTWAQNAIEDYGKRIEALERKLASLAEPEFVQNGDDITA
jgi:hypothetical protein